MNDVPTPAETGTPEQAGAHTHEPLRVEAVSHAYGRRQALSNVSLTLSPGEVFGLLGPNGAGKTTLIRAIAGRLSPTSGLVRVGGGDPHRDMGARGRIGLVPQHLALYDTLTARENLEVFGRLLGLTGKDARERAATMLEMIGLSDRGTARVNSLSGGMQRRLNIAAAVMHRPSLLLLDEPSVGVDVKALGDVIALVRTLREEGYAILMTTHNMALAEAVSTRVGILQGGTMTAEGTPAALKERVFGARQIAAVTFGDPVTDDAARTALLGLGLGEGSQPELWHGSVSGGKGVMDRLAGQPGLPPIRRMTLAEPGLAEIYVELTADTLSPGEAHLQETMA